MRRGIAHPIDVVASPGGVGRVERIERALHPTRGLQVTQWEAVGKRMDRLGAHSRDDHRGGQVGAEEGVTRRRGGPSIS